MEDDQVIKFGRLALLIQVSNLLVFCSNSVSRDSETFFPIISRVCILGIKIHTDSWAAYHET